MTKVVVSGALANRPHNGGGAWVRLNWLLGLKRLGFDVYFVEEIPRQACVAQAGGIAPFEDSVNLAFFRRVTRQFGLAGFSALVCEGGEQVHGMSLPELFDLAGSAGLLINLSGHLASAPLLDRFRRKVYVDLDPGFTQIWHASGNLGGRLAGHDFYFTVGTNVGSSDCPIPTGGIRWRPLRPPVVLDEWPVVDGGATGRFTTVASWRGAFGPVQLGDKTLGVKAHEFRKFLELPARSGKAFEIALTIHPDEEKDLSALRQHGWHLAAPAALAGTPDAFRQYVQASAAEFSAAQGVYVATNSGWFSDRTALYLATGKPALVQDTGFSRHYPVGEGLVPFQTLDEAVAGAERVVHDYEKHCRTARAIAEAHLDSSTVLGDLLAAVL